ncbi:MAG: hypothetical protein GY835_25025, partial [bacterium]|nr:hypothetical protein [bacterium]
QGQPRKFYAPLPQQSTLVLFADEDVDAMIRRHFKLGMPRLELGQFMIAHGADVDMSKVGRQMCSPGSGEHSEQSHRWAEEAW